MKFTFNNDGLLLLQEWLYAQSNEALASAAAAVQLNFKQWVADHFEMNAQQLLFLNQLDPQTLVLFASQSSFAIGNRLSISLDKASGGDEQGKVIWHTSTLRASNAWQNMQPSGELTFHIRYT